MTPARGLAARLTDRVDGGLDAAVGAFALWTLTYHLALVAGLRRDPTTLLWAGLVGLATLAAVAARRRRGRGRARGRPEQPARPVTLRPRSVAIAVVAVALAGALLAGIRVLDGAEWWALWVVGVAVSGAGVWMTLRTRPGGLPDLLPSRTTSLPAVAAVLAAAAAFALLSTLTQRPDSDDVFLMNKALHVEHDSGTFATRDTIFGDEVFRSTRPEGPASSIEAMVGVAARWTPFTSPTVGYLVLAPVVSALGVLALWRLLRTLRAAAPALATLAAAAFLALDGAQHASFGNFTFGRAWQGKVVFVFVVVPLLWHYALRWSRDGDGRSLVMLVAANVAAIGLTSTGAFVAPAVTVLASVAGRPGWSLRHVASLAAVTYSVGAGLGGVMASEGPAVVAGGPELSGGTALAGGTELAAGGLLGPAGLPRTLEPAAQWYYVFGDGFGMFLVTAAVLLAWMAVRDRSARLVLGGAPLAVFLLVLTPGALDVIGTLTNTEAILWRALWIIPVPAAVGLVLTAGVRSFPGWRRLLNPGALAVPVVALVVLGLVETPVPSPDNRAHFGDVTWDVDSGARRAAERVVAIADPGAVAAVPVDVGEVMAIMTLQVRAVNPRVAYITGSHAVPEFHARDRFLLSVAVSEGLPVDRITDFQDALDTLSVDVGCTRRHLDGQRVTRVLRGVGFERVDRDAQCAYWMRSQRGSD